MEIKLNAKQVEALITALQQYQADLEAGDEDLEGNELYEASLDIEAGVREAWNAGKTQVTVGV